MVKVEVDGSQQSKASFPFVAQTGETSQVDTRPAVEIIRAGEKLERFEIIPLTNIISETPVIDPVHASELAVDMAQGRGQLLPILVRVREDEKTGDLEYDVADGFHRTAGLKAAEQPTIKAVVMYGCSDAELIDKRIISANSVKSVKFGRIALWMNDGYNLTPWADQGIKLKDAVATTVFNSDEVKGAELSNPEVQKMKDWVEEKARHWQMSVSELWTNLGIIEQSDPRLVQLVRPKVEKGEESSFITQAQLKIVAELYPGPENYSVQRALINWLLGNHPSASQLEDMAWAIHENVKIGMKAKDVTELITRVEKGRESNQAEAENKDNINFEHNQNGRRGKYIPGWTLKGFREEISQLRWWEKIDGIKEKDRDIVSAIFGERKSLQEAVEQFGVSREEIGQIILDSLDRRKV